MKVVYLGVNEVEVVDRETNLNGLTLMIGKVVDPTFPDRPFLTICEEVEGGAYHTGHYDMNLMDAANDFYRRLGYLREDY